VDVTTLHLVRRGATPAAVGERDWIVDLDRRELVARATPPIAPGPLTYDQLVQLLFAANRVVTW
jgi:hypothetical protein